MLVLKVTIVSSVCVQKAGFIIRISGLVTKSFTDSFILFGVGFGNKLTTALQDDISDAISRVGLPRLAIIFSFVPIGTAVMLSSPPISRWPAVNEGPNAKKPWSLLTVRAFSFHLDKFLQIERIRCRGLCKFIVMTGNRPINRLFS